MSGANGLSELKPGRSAIPKNGFSRLPWSCSRFRPGACWCKICSG